MGESPPKTTFFRIGTYRWEYTYDMKKCVCSSSGAGAEFTLGGAPPPVIVRRRMMAPPLRRDFATTTVSHNNGKPREEAKKGPMCLKSLGRRPTAPAVQTRRRLAAAPHGCSWVRCGGVLPCGIETRMYVFCESPAFERQRGRHHLLLLFLTRVLSFFLL